MAFHRFALCCLLLAGRALAGAPARALYESFGFADCAPAGVNPAGIQTVVMSVTSPRASAQARRT